MEVSLDQVPELVKRLVTGEQRALSRLISVIENDSQSIGRVLQEVHPHSGHSYCIGVTGPPGAGKSTIVDGLTALYRAQGLSVGILAVDPTSPFSGGAFLGDRVRMQQHYLDKGVFIRSLATRGSSGGLSRITRAAAKLLDAAGKDIVMVETVGVGQTELEIMQLADTVLVVLVPEAGDAIQALKAGLLEIADIFVVNKADREGAGRMLTDLEASFNLSERPNWWRPPVLLTKAHLGEGIEEVYKAINHHRKRLEETSRLQEKRRSRQRQEFFKALEEGFGARLRRLVQREDSLAELMAQVEEGTADPYAAADRLLDRWVKEPKTKGTH